MLRDAVYPFYLKLKSKTNQKADEEHKAKK